MVLGIFKIVMCFAVFLLYLLSFFEVLTPPKTKSGGAFFIRKKLPSIRDTNGFSRPNAFKLPDRSLSFSARIFYREVVEANRVRRSLARVVATDVGRVQDALASEGKAARLVARRRRGGENERPEGDVHQIRFSVAAEL